MSGIFAKFQPRYAEQNVITFPVSPDKKPVIKHLQKVSASVEAKQGNRGCASSIVTAQSTPTLPTRSG